MDDSLRVRFDLVDVNLELGGQRFRLLKPRDADALLDDPEFADHDRLPYWAAVWASSQVIGERVLASPGAGQRLLELGCGLGLCSLAAARAGYAVLATDYEEIACRFARANAVANGLVIATRRVDWRSLPNDLGTFDVIIGADVLYERALGSLVAAALAQLLSPSGYALVSDPHRAAAENFPARCAEHGLHIDSVESFRVDDEGQPRTVDLYTVRRQVVEPSAGRPASTG